MIQRLIGAGIVAGGIYLFLNDSIIWGIALIVFGGAFFNGASHGTLLCFHFGDDDHGDYGGSDGDD